MRPHDVGFDEYYGDYSAQKEITHRVDKRRYPDLVLDQEKFEAFDVGTDLGSPVSRDYAERRPFEFDGTINTVHVKLQ